VESGINLLLGGEMNIIITGRHLELTGNLKQYAEAKIRKFNKYLNNITEAAVILSVEKYRHKAEVLLRVNGMMIQAESVTGEMYSSIDEVVEKLERQVKKYKEKWVSYRKGEDKNPVSLTFEESFPSIIKRKSFDIKPMSPEEAPKKLQCKWISSIKTLLFSQMPLPGILTYYTREKTATLDS
jgi:putative sigma-54 modulation protein